MQQLSNTKKNNMSSETKSQLERLATLEERTLNFEKTAERIEFSINEFIDKSPKKFAGKWVELVLITFIAGMMVYLFTSRNPEPPVKIPVFQTQNK
jgi:hypothetical protein